MLCHFLNRGITPDNIINLSLTEKMFYKSAYEIYIEEEHEKIKVLAGER